MQFDLQHLEGATQLLPGIEMTRAHGVADVAGNKFRLTVEAQAGGAYLELGIVVLDGRSHMTNFLTGQWQQVPPETLPFDFSNLGEDLAQILLSVQAPALSGQEQLEGLRHLPHPGTGGLRRFSLPGSHRRPRFRR